MNIAKVIKVYFIFVMVISSIALLSYNDNFGNYILSVLHVGESSANASLYTSVIAYDYEGGVFSSTNESSSLLNFSIINDPEKAFSAPGSENVEMMGFLFKTGDDVSLLKDLRLKVVGVDPKYIEKAVLFDGKKIVKVGAKDEEYFSFKQINQKIDPNAYKILYLHVSLSSELHTGQRFRMDIESPDDIIILTGSQQFIVDDYYPIEGKYLSIAVPRS